jgi:ADP-ribosylation factor-like protein 6
MIAHALQSRSRPLWDKQYAGADAVIFVVDSSDRMRLAVAKDELDHMLEQPAIRDRPVPLLFFANKMDLEGAMEPVECMAGLGLQGIPDRPWHIQASNARTGAGLDAGIRWLTSHVTRFLKVKATGFPARAPEASSAGASASASSAAPTR